MHSVKLGYLVCAITVHLLWFVFECHGNQEDVRALACVRACIRTCTCDLSSKREHQFKDFGARPSRNPYPLAHHTDMQPILKIPHLHMIDKVARNIWVSYEKWVLALN